MADRRLLMVFAHPDDETFGMGGTIAKYVAEGVEVHYFCATSGEVGTIPEAMQNLYPTTKELRLAELDCAAQKLGFQVTLGHYKDSGMMGSATSEDPECLWYRWNHEPETVVQHVVKTIREVQPQVIVTFNKYGGYGHPDHIAIQRATEAAFKLAGAADYTIVPLPPYQPQKLYYTALPMLFLRLMLLVLRLRGYDTRRMGENKDIDFEAVVENIEPVHTRVNIRDYLDRWDEANACHASQGGGGMSSRFPKWLRRWMLYNQGFTRLVPAPQKARIDEHDLFEGVTPAPLREVAL